MLRVDLIRFSYNRGIVANKPWLGNCCKPQVAKYQLY